jgi:hypothetical protein
VTGFKRLGVAAAILASSLCNHALATRYMENLGRGMVATRVSSSQVYVGWRMLGTDPAGIGFNLYRQTNGGTATKLNGSTVITTSTNYLDTSTSTSNSYTYYVKPVISGVEQAASASFTIASTVPSRKYLPIPLQAVPRGVYDQTTDTSYEVNHVYVGDLNGDGEYELIVKRLPLNDPNDYRTIKLEAYKMNGTFLWRVDLGPNVDVENSTQTATVLVYDFNGDGKAEVFAKTGEGTKFADGTTIGDTNGDGITDYRVHPYPHPTTFYHVQAGPEFVSMMDGMTGAELSRANFIPRGNITDWGDNYGHRASFTFATVAYLDGIHPSIVISRGPGDVMVVQAWDFTSGQIVPRWNWTARGKTFAAGTWWADGHTIRAVDVDGDGKDELSWGSCMLDDNGTVLYTTAMGHGDRFQITKFDPNRVGLQCFHIEQNNSTLLDSAFYDAGTGAFIQSSYRTAVGDAGRSDAGDYDASVKGLEYYSTMGQMFSCKGVKIWDIESGGFPALGIWWDADLQREIFTAADGDGHNPVINKWTASTRSCGRLLSLYSDDGSYSVTTPYAARVAFVGDILGDWREEFVVETSDRTKLRVYSAQTVSTDRIYTLMHNPAYRNAVTVKGYLCTNYPDFYMGQDMATPSAPDIMLVGVTTTPSPNPMTWVSVPAVAGVQSVTMTATTATSAGGVQYYFTCTAGGGHSSAWQASTTYTDTGLMPGVTYTYTVKARDAVNTSQITSSSSPASVLLNTGPIPDPMTWASAPAATGISGITMTATTAASSGGVEYYFTCTAGAGHSSGWQTSATYVDTGLASGVSFTYVVQARDRVTTSRVTAASSALSATTSPIPSLPAPGAYWPLDESAGDIAHDFSGNANQGTLTGAGLPSWDSGVYGSCLTFGANGGRVFVPHSASISFGDQDFSVSLWLKEPATITSGTQHEILIKGTFGSPTDAGSGKRYELYRKRDVNGDIFYWTIDDGAHMTELGIPATSICTGTWVHVVAVRDSVSNQLRLYANGVQKSMLSSVVTDISQAESLWLGDAGMAGSLDDVRIYACALTADQVAAIYLGCGLADTTPPMPDPMTWANAPASVSYNTILMAASAASDAAGVEYYFANITDPNHDSGWQDSVSFSDANLANNATYVYRVRARDKSAWHNETAPSDQAAAETPLYSCLTSPSTDLNGDCQTTLLDVAVFSNSWMLSGVSIPADFSGDGVVDFNDMTVLVGEWLQCGRMPQTECLQ